MTDNLSNEELCIRFVFNTVWNPSYVMASTSQVTSEMLQVVCPGNHVELYGIVEELSREENGFTLMAFNRRVREQGLSAWAIEQQSRIDKEMPMALDEYTQRVIVEWKRAFDIMAGERYVAALKAGDVDPVQAKAELVSNLSATESMDRRNRMRRAIDSLVEVNERVRRVQAGEETWTVPTGFSRLNDSISLEPQKLTCVEGLPGHGKTSLVLSMMIRLHHYYAGRGERKDILFMSADMPEDEISMRLANIISCTCRDEIIRPGARQRELDRYYAAESIVDKMNIHIDDTTEPTPEYIRFKLATLPNPAMFVVDYHTAMKSTSRDKSNEGEYYKGIVLDLSNLAKNTKTHGIVLAHLIKSVETRASKIPKLTDMLWGGHATYDQVLGVLYQGNLAEEDGTRMVEPIIRGNNDSYWAFPLKNRYGSGKPVLLHFDGPSTSVWNSREEFEAHKARL